MARAFGEIAERLRRSTVEVRLRGPHGRDGAGGSGVIATPDGRIVTNAHVARDAGASVRLWDGREFPATLLARDCAARSGDAQVQAAGLPAATFGDSSALRVGELVMAIGNPMGFIGALTTGVVHALGSLAGFGRQSWVLADVRLAPGNSGGPLADAHGRVIGINTMIVNGLGAAVPGNAVTAFLRRGASGFSLGVTVQPVRLEDRRFGLLVLKVEPGSAAAAAPLWTGDVLTGAGGRPFRSVDDLHLLMDGMLDEAPAASFICNSCAATAPPRAKWPSAWRVRWRRRRDSSADRGAFRDRARGTGVGRRARQRHRSRGRHQPRRPERGHRPASAGRGAGGPRNASRRAARGPDRAGGARRCARHRGAGARSRIFLDRRRAARRHPRRAARRPRARAKSWRRWKRPPPGWPCCTRRISPRWWPSGRCPRRNRKRSPRARCKCWRCWPKAMAIRPSPGSWASRNIPPSSTWRPS